MIRVRALRKELKVHRRPAGFGAALKSVFRRPTEIVRAVDGVTFDIEPGERVGFLGPNGAGKTTSLKLLSGLLHPTSGEVAVDGFEPRRRDPDFLRRITLVMGQKQQLIWDLPPAETYALNRAIFGISEADFRAFSDELAALLDIESLSEKPTRKLSLGERMKCELFAALLHRPTTLFLDEPTIGLDVSMQVAIRDFIRRYGERHGATVLLTSHYMKDVIALCPRIIVLDHGQIIYDGDLRALARKLHPDKLVSLSLSDAIGDDRLERLGTITLREPDRVVLRVRQDRLREVVSHILASMPIADLSVEDPPIEDVMRQLFAEPARTDNASQTQHHHTLASP